MSRILAACAALVFVSAVAAQQQATHWFDSNGVVISYTDVGRGAPVLLIHGFTGSASRHFGGTGVISALQQAGYRVIALDCRGHGQSDKPLDSSQYGLEMVYDVIRLLDHLKVYRAHIVGYSMGAGIAEQLLVKYPSRATTVTLLGSPGLQLIELPGVNHATGVRASTAHLVAFLDKHRDN